MKQLIKNYVIAHLKKKHTTRIQNNEIVPLFSLASKGIVVCITLCNLSGFFSEHVHISRGTSCIYDYSHCTTSFNCYSEPMFGESV